jgi:hypothetical protein
MNSQGSSFVNYVVIKQVIAKLTIIIDRATAEWIDYAIWIELPEDRVTCTAIFLL